MSYIIKNTDGSVLTTIAPKTVDSTTSLQLPGYGYPKWAEAFNQNFVYMLQNFAAPNAPSSPVPGQIWFNNSTGNLSVYVSVSSGWQIIATASWLATQGYITQEDLNLYATIEWVNAQGFISESAVGSLGLVTQSYIAAQNFITATYLTSQNYINQSTLTSALNAAEATLSSTYITEASFVEQNFVTQSYVNGQNYITATYLAAQNYVQSTTLAGYLTANQTITISGDASGSGTTSINLILAASGVTPGTYTKVSVDSKGRVISGGTITSSDITNALGFTPPSIANFAATLGSNGYQKLPSGLIIQWITGAADPADNTSPTQTLNWALAFPTQLIGASVSTYIANTAIDDLWYQVISSGSNTSQVIVQRQAGQGVSAMFNAATTPFIIGLGY